MSLTFSPLIDVTITTPAGADGPKVTDWMSVTIAAAAVVIASIAAYFNWRTNQHQAKQLDNLETESRKRQQQERQQQASHVWAIVTPGNSVEIRNESGLPVYEIDSIVDPTGINAKIPQVRYLDPAHDRKTKIAENSKQEVHRAALRQAETVHKTGSPELNEAVADLLKTARLNGVQITFRDSSNNRWTRTPKGELYEHQNDKSTTSTKEEE